MATFMQACGLVNGHVTSCFRFKELTGSSRSKQWPLYALTVGRAERRRAKRRGADDPVAEAQARSRFSSYSQGSPAGPMAGFHHYRASLRQSGAWPFLRLLLLVLLAVLLVAVVTSIAQTGG